jgi:hypothetical protein
MAASMIDLPKRLGRVFDHVVRIEMKTEGGRINLLTLVLLAVVVIVEALGGLFTIIARGILAGLGRDASAVPSSNLLVMLVILAFVGVVCVLVLSWLGDDRESP